MLCDGDRRRFLLVGLGAAVAGCGGRQPPQPRQSGVHYQVIQGDTLASISRRSGLSISTIYRVNNLRSRDIAVGQTLWLPGVSNLQREQHDYIEVTPQRPTPLAGAIVERPGWRARAMKPNHDPMHRIVKITVHHTAMDSSDNLSDAAFMRLVQDRHMALGWADIGYHFIIGHDGRIYRGRPERVQGAHVGGDRNKLNLGIALRGNFMKRMPRDAQMATLRQLLPSKQQQYGVPTNMVFGHRDLGTTLCPGDHLYRWLSRFKLGQRV